MIPCLAQSVPDTARQSFTKHFPNILPASWEVQNENYKAGFTKTNRKAFAVFNKDGKLLETGTSLIANDLPYDITNYIETMYNSAHIESVFMVTRKATRIYEIRIYKKKAGFRCPR